MPYFVVFLRAPGAGMTYGECVTDKNMQQHTKTYKNTQKYNTHKNTQNTHKNTQKHTKP